MEGRHLIVVKPGALGDTLLLAPVLRAARSHRPDLRVTVVGTAPAVNLLRRFGVADATFAFDRLHLFLPPKTGEPDFSDALVMAFLGRETGEPDPFVRRGAERVVWRKSRPGNAGPHVVVHLHNCLSRLLPALPEPVVDPFPVTPLSDPLFAGPYIVLAPGAGSVAKQMPLSRFLSIAEAGSARGLTPVFVTGEAEAERGLAEPIPDRYPHRVSPPLPELAALLAGATHFYGNDSGPAHLAALVGAKTTVYFGGSAPALWRPWGPRVTVERF